MACEITYFGHTWKSVAGEILFCIPRKWMWYVDVFFAIFGFWEYKNILWEYEISIMSLCLTLFLHNFYQWDNILER